MTQRLKVASLIWLAAASALMPSAAKADQWDKLTTMTFNEPVEIPGSVLSAGTYVFKLLDTNSDRTVVQVFTQDQKQLIATIMAVPAYRLEPTGETAISLEERPSGSPEALHSWFYPGDNYGVEFVYPKTEKQFADRSEPATPAAAPLLEPEPVPGPVPVMNAVAESSPLGTSVVTEETVIITEDVVQSLDDSGLALPDTLPQTAGNSFAILLCGILLLSGGLTAVRFAARQN